MQENNEKNIKLRDDNLEMANKISTLCEQFEKREQQVSKIGKQLDLEKQLSEATLNKAQLEFQAEREIWNKEREIHVERLKASEETRTKMQEKIKSLEEHLQMYTGKYEEFESTISKSSQVFDNCKSAMLKMTSQISKLEKDLKISNERSKKHEKNVIDLSHTNEWQNNEILSSRKKVQQLQKLCRQLQIDRSSYLKLLKTNGIEPTPPTNTQALLTLPVEAMEPEGDTLTKKEKHIQWLKENLNSLQEQCARMEAGKNELQQEKQAEEAPNDTTKQETEKDVVEKDATNVDI